MTLFRLAALGAALAAAGCVSVPSGPSNLALPGTGKSFDQFRVDDGSCRHYAYDAIGGQSSAQAQANSGVVSAVAGAAIGALIGGAAGGGHGAAIGAGVGGATGGLVGIGAGETSAYETQRRYDQAYTQCMYGKGHRVAVSGRFAPRYETASGYYAPPPPRTTYVPPPGSAPAPGAYPPPPPGSPPPDPSWIVR
jgi:hypothetical protein